MFYVVLLPLRLPQITHVKKVYPDFSGEVLLICIASASAVSRLVVGRVSDLACVSRLYLQQCAFVTLGIVTSLIPLASTFYELCAITLVMGVSDGCIICLLGPIVFDLVGPTGASQAIGFLLGLVAIPATFGPPAAGEFDLQRCTARNLKSSTRIRN